MGTAAVAGVSDWYNFMSKNMPSYSDQALASWSRLDEGGEWRSVDGSCGKSRPRDPVPPLHRLQCRYLLTPPRTLHPFPLLPPARQMRDPQGIKADPPLPEWRLLMTMNAKTTTKQKEGASSLKRLDNRTHYKITEDRVGSGELTSMVTVTKKHLHCQIKWGSVYRGFFFVK